MQLIGGIWKSIPGTAKLFILPNDEHRERNLNRVRRWLADNFSDPHWISDAKEADVRILVIVHRMAAIRLGFPDLYSAFNDAAPESFVTGFREGNAWPLKHFTEILLPLVLAFNQRRSFEVISLLRNYCPRLNQGTEKTSDILSELNICMKDLVCKLASDSDTTVLEILRFVKSNQLIQIDERYNEFVDNTSQYSQETESDDEDKDKTVTAMSAFLNSPAKQLWGYHTYINDESPYSTQQGIKGAEFERVLVILDDEEGRHNQFSYDKLLGIKGPSKTDIENTNLGKETVLDRTRRLFYVCCSRSLKDLAVVLYTVDVEKVADKLKEAGLFEPTDIYTLDDLDKKPQKIHPLAISAHWLPPLETEETV